MSIASIQYLTADTEELKSGTEIKPSEAQVFQTPINSKLVLHAGYACLDKY